MGPGAPGALPRAPCGVTQVGRGCCLLGHGWNGCWKPWMLGPQLIPQRGSPQHNLAPNWSLTSDAVSAQMLRGSGQLEGSLLISHCQGFLWQSSGLCRCLFPFKFPLFVDRHKPLGIKQISSSLQRWAALLGDVFTPGGGVVCYACTCAYFFGAWDNQCFIF